MNVCETYIELPRCMFTAAERRVDVLINNAGVLQSSRAVTTDGFELHLGVNYLGQSLNYTQLSRDINFHMVCGSTFEPCRVHPISGPDQMSERWKVCTTTTATTVL